MIIYSRGWQGDPDAGEQVRLLLGWAEQRGWTVKQVIRDLDWQQVLGQVGQGDVILLSSLSRWAKDWPTCEASLARLMAAGVEVMTLSGWQLSRDGIPSGQQEYEQGVQRERIRQGLVAAKAAGRRLGRQPGLHSRSKELMPKVQALLKQGYSYRKIAQEVGISKNTVQAIVRELEQDQAAAALDWSLLLEVEPGDWLGLQPLWDQGAQLWQASLWLTLGGEWIGRGSVAPLDLSRQQCYELYRQGNLQLQQGQFHCWVGLVSALPPRYLWGIRSKPWPSEHVDMLHLLQARLARLLRLWFPCAKPLLHWRLPQALQALQQQLRSPITNLRMGLLMLSQAQLSERQRHYLQIIQNEQQHYQDLIREWQTRLLDPEQEPKLESADWARLCPGMPSQVLAELQDFQTDPELLEVLARLALTDHLYQVKVGGQYHCRWCCWQIEHPQELSPAKLEDIRCLTTALRGEVIWDPPQLRIWLLDLGGELLHGGGLIREDRQDPFSG
ncbi:MAG: helix-turn-helix domain-containing protein [Thermostichales cyanobacterium SZTDM-1c_bins_54]